MEEIKVGEYVKTDNGEIHKVKDIKDLRIDIPTGKIMFRNYVDDYYGYHKEDRFIVKHSPNIIDLIEEGDYVNGKRVQEKISNMFLEVSSSDLGNNRIFDYMIETIVTKEQFKAIEYKVGG